MTGFTTRIELHRATAADYEDLHAHMARQGFSRTIVSDSGARYQLPTAEYNIEAELTRADVLARAKAAAGAVKASYEVLVTESAGRTWVGLPAA